MHRGHAAHKSLAEQHREVAEAHEPFGIAFEQGPVDAVDGAYGSVASANAPKRAHRRLRQSPVDLGGTGVVGSAQLTVGIAQAGGQNKFPTVRGCKRLGGGDLLGFRKATRTDEGDLVAGLKEGRNAQHSGPQGSLPLQIWRQNSSAL